MKRKRRKKRKVQEKIGRRCHHQKKEQLEDPKDYGKNIIGNDTICYILLILLKFVKFVKFVIIASNYIFIKYKAKAARSHCLGIIFAINHYKIGI